MMTETNRVEFKVKLNDDLEKEIVAFLNYREGGVVYIGIDKDGNAHTVSNIDELQLKIKDRLKNNISPSILGLFDVVVEEIGLIQVIKIIIASGSEKPYYIQKRGMSSKGCFIRIGSASEPMSIRMIEELFSKRTRNSISKVVSPRQDLSFEQLKIYYESKGLVLNTNFAKNLELLSGKEYNYVAYLMADRNNISIKVAKYSGLDRVELIESNEYGYQSIIKATKSILDKLDIENKTATKITSKERLEQRVWNAIALREAVINAIIHNDYTNEIPPKFEIFDDRLEITSAGSLPSGMNQEEFFDGVSNPRNKEIMRIFKDIDMVEQLGSGIPRILRAYGKDSFKFMENFTRMIFQKNSGGSMGGSIGGSITTQINLTDRQRDILNLIEQNSKISYRNIAKVLDIADSAVKKHLNTLKSKGVLKRVGGTRGYWELTDMVGGE